MNQSERDLIGRQFLVLALSALAVYDGSVLALYLYGLSAPVVMALSVIIMNQGFIFWGVWFMGRHLAVMNRMAIQSTDNMAKLQSGLTPVIDDLSVAVREGKQLVHDVGEKHLEKIQKTLDEIMADDSIKKGIKSVAELPEEVRRLRVAIEEAKRGGVAEAMRRI